MTERKIRKTILSSIPINTDRLVIRYITPNDVYDMYEYASIPEVSKYLLWYPHINIQATEGYIESLQKRYAKGLYSDWAVVLKESDKMIGTVGFANIDSSEKSCEIGYVLSPNYRKCGYMTEAIMAVIDLAFNTIGFKKATLRIMQENVDSIKIAKKLGFMFSHETCLNIKDKECLVLNFILENKK